MVAAVKRVAKQPFTQLLTILDELMSCIFTIFQDSNDAALIDQTYATLIGVLGEANKNTNIKYKPRIEEWIEHYFKYSKVWRILSIQQSRLLQWIASAEAVEAQSKDAPTALKQRSAEMIRQLQNSMRGVKVCAHFYSAINSSKIKYMCNAIVFVQHNGKKRNGI